LANREIDHSVLKFAEITHKPISETWQEDLRSEKRMKPEDKQLISNHMFVEAVSLIQNLPSHIHLQVQVVDPNSMKKIYGPFQDWFDVVTKTSPQSSV